MFDFEFDWEEISDNNLLCIKDLNHFKKGYYYEYYESDGGYVVRCLSKNNKKFALWLSPINNDLPVYPDMHNAHYICEYFQISKEEEFKKMQEYRKMKREQFYNDH